MKQVISIVLLFFALFSTCLADDLEIKVNQKAVKLPYWPASKPNYGAVIIVRGGDPVQWSEPMAHLAQLLAQNGWSTVLLNSNPEIDSPWLNQLPEAISTLRQNKNKRIVLIHYGNQLNTTLDYFSKPQGKTINALVLLSAYDEKESSVKPDSLRFPIFDIEGQFDYDMIKDQFTARKTLFKSAAYTAMKIPGADNEYNYTQELLASFLTGWMLRIPESTVAAPPINAKSLQSYIEPIYWTDSQLVAINHLFLQKDILKLEPLAQK
ncbi:alpha/beta hydrolase [Legionella sp. km772]|uniref:alpha/beta hydrolase n=1 Tax=Legionella sp. km772 TaxID=2498111 RepID=UPI000F8CF18D|nr:alpha/beta hydrolase [Legionella sp. km772]RUR11373.1 alpha/beta hydrolase [Legionella sp. km772]